MPEAKARLLDDIVLGGSHARETGRKDSDLDIGLYYRERWPFRIAEIEEIARRFSASGRPTVTAFVKR